MKENKLYKDGSRSKAVLKQPAQKSQDSNEYNEQNDINMFNSENLRMGTSENVDTYDDPKVSENEEQGYIDSIKIARAHQDIKPREQPQDEPSLVEFDQPADIQKISDFMNAEIEESELDLQNYKDHIRKLFEKKPINVETMKIDEDADDQDFDDDLDSFSNMALDSKLPDTTEKVLEKLNLHTKNEKDLMQKFREDVENLKFPGTVQDLEPELQNLADVIDNFDPDGEDITDEQDEEIDILPTDFAHMLDGNRNKDIEKVVYFSTLNSQDKPDTDGHSQPKTE